MTSPVQRPAPDPSHRVRGGGAESDRCGSAAPNPWLGSGPRVELERASLAEDAFLFLT